MLAKALSCAVVGLESALVEVEVDLSAGLLSFQIVVCTADNSIQIAFRLAGPAVIRQPAW